MPELPEVETVRRGLEPHVTGTVIAKTRLHRADLRFPFPNSMAERLTGARVLDIGRRAKYLLFSLSNGETLISHLGMSGSFRIEDSTIAGGTFHLPRSKSSTHDHVELTLTRDGGDPLKLVYNDPRRFGFMLLTATATLDEHPLIANLGLEPTGNRLDGAWLAEAFRNKAAPLKAALLDQKIIAGLGNIYVCEALHRAGLSPRRSARTLHSKARGATERADRLAEAVRVIIGEAIDAGGSSLRDYVHTDGSLGYFQHRFRVYGREGDPCPTPDCSAPIRRIVQSGRSTFFCPSCQR